MQNFFSAGRRSFLTGGGMALKTWLKTWGQTLANMAERGPFGVFKGTILNEGVPHKRPPLKTPLYRIMLIYNIDKVDIAKFKTSICNISQFLPQRIF